MLEFVTQSQNVLTLQVQIWNNAVNVSAIYDKYLKGTEEGLVGYYKSVGDIFIYNCLLKSYLL